MYKRKRYKYSDRNSQPSSIGSKIMTVVPILLLVAGVYTLMLAFAPKFTPLLNSGKVEKAINNGLPKIGDDRLYVEKLGINMPVKAGDASVMKDSIWHRIPERGDPVKGGNFILSAHRWKTGKNPAETIAQSPLYNADRLEVGDDLFVDYEGKRYKYQIYETYQVKPNQVEIEAPVEPGGQAKLTLYTCTLKGASDGRVVIQAKLAEVS
jgi:sortase A